MLVFGHRKMKQTKIKQINMTAPPAPLKATRPALKRQTTDAMAYLPEPCRIPRAEMRQIVLEMIG